ncbi:MAG: thiol:disulfide interchange protein DsbA/DsbL [Thiohalomonadales bacterium]
MIKGYTKIKRTLLILSLSIFSLNAYSENFVEGVDYKKITPVVGTSDSSKIEVLELFSYGCPHCNSFEGSISQWLKSKPANVDFGRRPVSFGRQVWANYAQAYYTAEVLDVLDKTHAPMFNAIHKENNKLSDVASIRELFLKNGISSDDFESSFYSFAVDARLRRDQRTLGKYQSNSVPTMIVNGKYRIDSSMTDHNNEKMLEVVNFLIKKESAKTK